MCRACRWLCLLAIVACCLPVQAAEPTVDFQRDVQPIFRRHCYRCHGTKNVEGGLRLSTRAGALSESDSGEVAIRPGNSAESLLITRLTDPNFGDVMPLDGEPLAAADLAVIRRWIDQGARWPDSAAEDRHWAYVKPARPPLPSASNRVPNGNSDNAGESGKSSGSDTLALLPFYTSYVPGPNAIDHFVLARLRAVGLSPAAPADRARLIRRVSLALVGLPPSPEEVERFVHDDSPDAYERLVDRLLASERYGERWAQRWLDLARYADSNGYQADQLRDSWAYRDWVIRAFNDGKPFDEFVVEQLAGDLLPNATVDQKVATGFHRTVTCNVEAGVFPEENRTNQIVDRVNTSATVFLGTTLECCQCHDHKYDPFTSRDYYRLFAYFNNTPLEVDQDKPGVQFNFVGPAMDLPLPPDEQQKVEALTAELEVLKTQRNKSRAEHQRGYADWKEQTATALAQSPPRWVVLPITEFHSSAGETSTPLADGSLLIGGPVPDKTVHTLQVASLPPDVLGFKVEALADDSLPGRGPGRGDKQRPNFILSEFTIAAVLGDKSRNIALFDAQADYSQPRWEVAQAIDGKRDTGWAIGQQFGQSHWAIFHTKQALSLAEGETLRLTLDQQYGQGRTIGRVRISALSGDPRTVGLPEEIQQLLQKDKLSKADEKKLREFHEQSNPKLKKLDADVTRVQKQLNQAKPPTTLVMVELDQPRTTYMFNRGNYLDPGEEVIPGTPEALHPFNEALPPNRLGLAKWIVSPENPLLARVTVNRWWAALFGRGLVSTPEDFGTQGELPTHPELLDWLAVELVESGWNMKHIHKLIVMSATFRQSSRVEGRELRVEGAESEQNGAKPDSDSGSQPSTLNAQRFYARGPRFRLTAETIRDNALQIAGLLSQEMYGPPVMPFQPNGIWRAVGRNAPKWTTAIDEDRFRRGVYVVWRRAAPYPSFVTFDAPDRAACTVERPRTNTPLQALTLLNDPVYAEAALALAQRMLEEAPSGEPESVAAYGFRLCVAREPSPREIAILVRLYQAERKKLAEQPNLAEERRKNLLPRLRNEKLDATELAAWFAVANALLNLDETITLN